MNFSFPRIHRHRAIVWASIIAMGLFSAHSASAQTATSQQLKCSPCYLTFGDVPIGTSKKLSLTLKNSGSRQLKITRYNKMAPGFQVTSPALPHILAAGATKSMTVLFKPASASSVDGTILVENDKSWIGLAVRVTGKGGSGGSLSATPTAVNFGTVPVGSSATQLVTIKNGRGTSVKLMSASLSGAAFSFSGLNLPLTLNAGQSITFTTKFGPKAAGAVTGSIKVTSSATTTTVNLAGTGGTTGSLSLSPTTLNFGAVTVGTQKSMTATLTAGGASVKVTSSAVSTSEFAVSGIAYPLSLAAGQSKSFTVVFKPGASGTATANLKFTTGSGSTVSESLTGSGASASAHSVSLAWNPSSSGAVVGYNVYRGTTTGGPYNKINSSLESSTAFGDANVAAGKTYFYVVTAVDGGGTESGFSNQVKAIIPSP
jgi:hypothetical protein